MASPFYTTATLSCASTILIPKSSLAKHFSNCRCPNLIAQFRVLNIASILLTYTQVKLQRSDLATVRLFKKNAPLVVSRFRSCAMGDADSGNTLDVDDENGGDRGENIEDELYELQIEPDDEDNGIEIEIEIEKTGKNSRRIRSRVAVQASFQTVWNLLTDYERLADFIPSLAVSQLLEKRENFARLFQIGQQNLAFGLKFNAKGTIDCFEKDLQTLPFGQKRDIEFKMVEGDFQQFEGKWSVEQGMNCGGSGQEFETTLVYIVDVKPKLWLPVRLVEGRLCNEIRTNLLCIQKEAEKDFQNEHSDS